MVNPITEVKEGACSTMITLHHGPKISILKKIAVRYLLPDTVTYNQTVNSSHCAMYFLMQARQNTVTRCVTLHDKLKLVPSSAVFVIYSIHTV